MSINDEAFKVTMIDGLVGNDYSICLCSALAIAGVNVELISSSNRVVNTPVNFEIKYWMPSKGIKSNKIQKVLQYLAYLKRVFLYAVGSNKSKRIVHVQFFRIERVESILFLLLRLFGVKLVFTAHNVLPHEFNRLDYLSRHIIYRCSKSIIVHSEDIKNKIVGTFNIPPKKISIIPHGNFDQYVPVKSISRAEARVKLGLENEDKVILFFGYIRPYKGLDLLLDAFEISARENKRLKLVIAGAASSVELENQYKEKVEKISKNGSIVYHPGFVPFDEVAKYFVATDVVMLPYKAIDHSGIIHLAYSFGKPLIATNVGDFSEIIENGKSGYIVKVNNTECLAETILQSFENGTDLEEMGAYARKLSETKYSWLEIAKKAKALYESC